MPVGTAKNAQRKGAAERDYSLLIPNIPDRLRLCVALRISKGRTRGKERQRNNSDYKHNGVSVSGRRVRTRKCDEMFQLTTDHVQLHIPASCRAAIGGSSRYTFREPCGDRGSVL